MTTAGIMPGDFISHLQPNITIPCVALSASRTLLESGRFSCLTMAGFAIELMLEAYSRGESIEIIDSEITVPSDLGAIQAQNRELGRALRHAIEVIPVEELFPSNPWDTRHPESTLSCYQQLAAKFVRFGDLQAAESCLNQADRIAESPRSLALRAVVAMERGETLGAIAKLITSLQEYEQQRQPRASIAVESGTNPPFDSVNTELKAGLDALNAQDNSSALRHFARAVREFDSFYRDSGLLLLV
jgi:tetratricopeptide (TPR) repeat protein